MARYTRIALIATLVTAAASLLLGPRPAAAQETQFFNFDNPPLGFDGTITQGTITATFSGGSISNAPLYFGLVQKYYQGGPITVTFNQTMQSFSTNFAVTFQPPPLPFRDVYPEIWSTR